MTRGTGLADTMTTDGAWAAFLGALDPMWARVPETTAEAPFLGNGGLGAVVHRTGTGRLTFRLGDSRVRDHQGTGGTNFGDARLPVGDLTLDTAGEVVAVSLRLSLWDAQLAGTVTTTRGVLDLVAFVGATRDVLVVAASVESGTEHVAWTFSPAPARSPRLDFKPGPDGLAANPAPAVAAGAGTCTQDLAAGGQTVTGWQVRTEADGRTRTLLATVAHTFPSSSAGSVAAVTLSGAAALSLSELGAEHRSWWHGFYPRSFLTIPDTRLQGFYWIQLYKMASATRRDRPVLGTCGPWLEETPWPATWWNLNVQLEYWLLNATGHPELDSLSASLDRYRDSLVANVPEAYRADSMGMARTSQEDLRTETVAVPGGAGTPEVGNLTWALHNAWLAYRHSMDDSVLADLVFPLLRQAVNYYLHFLTRDSAGVYHLPTTYSPEYASTRDCNYDLALLHWGCSCLLAASARLGLDDPLAPTWRDVLEHLAPPPQDAEHGLWIGADVQLTSSHRHYSHLLWFYPLYQLDVTTSAASRHALVRSLDTWLGLAGRHQGYTFTGSGSMYAALGDGDRALSQLQALLDRFVLPNTMYRESGPVIETPLSGAQTIHDMLLQSWGGTIRVFPAVPSTWPDVTVHDLRTEGAFLVSAGRRAGTARFVRVRSLAGEPCRVLPGNLPAPYDVQSLSGAGPVTWSQDADGALQLALARGDDVLVVTRGTDPDLTIAPLPGEGRRHWGLPIPPPRDA